MRSCTRQLLAGVVLASAILIPAVSARASGEPETSLQWVPADVGFYSVMLRNREQIETVARSHAWAKVRGLPFVRHLLHEAREHLDHPEGPLGAILQLYEMPENRDLVRLLGDMASDEIFCFGGPDWIDFAQTAGTLVQSLQFDPEAIRAQIQGKRDEAAPRRLKPLLDALSKNIQSLRLPDLAIGFRIADPARAQAQVARLESWLKNVAEKEPRLQGRVARSQVAGGDFLTLTLDGSLIPWKEILDEDDYDKYEDTIKKLKELKLTVAVGTWKQYALVLLGPTLDHLARWGGTDRLAERPELKPVRERGGSRLTSVFYVSKPLRTRLTTTPKDIDSMIQIAEDYLDKASLPEEMHDRLAKDLKALGTDLKPFFPEPGAFVQFASLNDPGQESYAYDWGQHPRTDASQSLTLLNHVGGDPVFAHVYRVKVATQGYDLFVKWLAVLDGYVQDFVLPLAGQERRERYEELSKTLRPLLKRLDTATRTKLLPSLKDGQRGFVLDVKLTSPQWYRGVPGTESPLPMIEPAIICGISDADRFRAAFAEYRSVLNDLILNLRNLGHNQIPPLQIPEPEDRPVAEGTLYYYPNQLLQMLGIDPQLQPTAGLSKDVLALTISKAHAQRLLAHTPLRAVPGPLADPARPLAGATFVDWPPFIDAVRPWLDLAIQAGGLKLPGDEGAAESDDQRLTHEPTPDTRSQIHTLLDVLKCWRGYTSATYLQDGALVTHGQSVFEDR